MYTYPLVLNQLIVISIIAWFFFHFVNKLLIIRVLSFVHVFIHKLFVIDLFVEYFKYIICESMERDRITYGGKQVEN